MKIQRGQLSPTKAESHICEYLGKLQEDFAREGINLAANLVIADGWGLLLYPEDSCPEAIEGYCTMMAELAGGFGVGCRRWNEIIDANEELFEAGKKAARSLPDFDRNTKCQAARTYRSNRGDRTKADLHISMRAAEVPVLLKELGCPLIVLSTETRKEVEFDYLLASKDDYPAIFSMPRSPYVVGDPSVEELL